MLCVNLFEIDKNTLFSHKILNMKTKKQWVNPEIKFTDLEETYGGGGAGTAENTYVHIS
jgi:hypothetical protein